MKRNIVTSIILSIITCGIYSIYWDVMICNETNELSGDYTPTPVALILLSIITCGIYYLYWWYRVGEKLDQYRESRGMDKKNLGILLIILSVISGGLVAEAITQTELNDLL